MYKDERGWSLGFLVVVRVRVEKVATFVNRCALVMYSNRWDNFRVP